MRRTLTALTALFLASAAYATIPAAPSNFVATNLFSAEVDFAWADNSNNENGFNISRLINGTYTTIRSVGPNVTTFSDLNVTPGATYSYKVRSYNGSGTSSLSNAVVVTSPNGGPTPTPTPTPSPSPTPSPTPTPTPPPNGLPGRIAVSCDGNFHDRDDINSSGWELAILAQGGRAADLVYFGHSDHYWKTDSSQESQMVTSANQAAGDWGVDSNLLRNARTNNSGAVDALSAEINKSTASNPLIIVAAGPMEIVGRALAQSKQTNSGSLQFVTVISHSSWNNTHAAQSGPGEGLTGTTYSFSDFGNNGKALGAHPLQLAFQSNLNGASYASFSWALNSPDPRLQHLYQRGVVAGKSAFDCSDSGMIFYVVTGKSNATASDYRAFFNQ